MTKNEAITELDRITQERSIAWTQSTERAKAVLRALPDDIPLPEIGEESDNWVGLEWLIAPKKRFSVSVGPTGLGIAWLNDACSNSKAAKGAFELPAEQIEILRELLR
jgi:hypothetical protein